MLVVGTNAMGELSSTNSVLQDQRENIRWRNRRRRGGYGDDRDEGTTAAGWTFTRRNEIRESSKANQGSMRVRYREPEDKRRSLKLPGSDKRFRFNDIMVMGTKQERSDEFADEDKAADRRRPHPPSHGRRRTCVTRWLR